MSHNRLLAFAALLSAWLISTACSSAPSGPEKGTPTFSWAAAKETFAAGDYNKTMEHLDNVLATGNEYTARALPWSLVLNAGMAAGYSELADDWATGTRGNKTDKPAFRRQVTADRGEANRLALHFADNTAKLATLKGDTVPLAFSTPKGSPGPVAGLVRVTSGILLLPADIEATQKRTVERAVLMAACRAAGAPDDPAKTQQILQGGNASVPRSVFQLAMANALYNDSQLYTSDKLDNPERMAILCQRSQDLLKGVPATKDSKELAAKIAKSTKKGKKA